MIITPHLSLNDCFVVFNGCFCKVKMVPFCCYSIFLFKFVVANTMLTYNLLYDERFSIYPIGYCTNKYLRNCLF